MTHNTDFLPDWLSPPGNTLNDYLIEKNISKSDLTNYLNMSNENIEKLLAGELTITPSTAKLLEDFSGISKTFWIQRETQYRSDIERINKKHELEVQWLNNLPFSDMVKFKWVKNQRNTKAILKECLNYFDVSSVDEWFDKYNELIYNTQFKMSSSFDTNIYSVITWLRQGVIKSGNFDLENWNSKKFKKTLFEVRKLTRVKDPNIFLPLIKEQFSNCGVCFIVSPIPKKCHASGATFFLNPQKAIMIMSFRHKTDDHFWFSLFHEAAHLLLHGKQELIIEINKESISEINISEKEANDFSMNILIPDKYKAEFMNLNTKNWREIVRFAKKIDVSAGILVGQLQHLGLIKHSHYNKLKTRYENKSIFIEQLSSI